MTVLIAPAIWNHFPLLQYDTGGYLARWYEGTLVPSRAVVYGLILNAGVPLSFWPVLLVQSALTVWVVALTLRAHGLGAAAFAAARRHRRAVGRHHAALADRDPAHRHILRPRRAWHSIYCCCAPMRSAAANASA